MKPLRIEFDVIKEDLPTAAAVVADRDPRTHEARRKAQRIVAVAILVLATLLIIGIVRPWAGIYWMTLGCIGGVILGMITRFPTRQAFRKMAREQTATVLATAAGKATLGPRSVEISSDGIASTSEFARTLFTWRAVIDVIPSPDHLIVILPGPLCLCVPRRAFDTDSDFEQFGETMTELATTGGGLTGRSPLA